MGYEFVDHTADLGIDVQASTLDALFSEAALGFADCITDVTTVEARRGLRLSVRSPSLESLLVDWLGELLYVFETRGEIFSAVEVEVSEDGPDWVLVANVRGELFDDSRHPLKVPIKAVTWHDLRVEQHDGVWEARVIFDI